MVAVIVSLAVSITVTVPLSKLVTYSRLPSGVMATTSGPPHTWKRVMTVIAGGVDHRHVVAHDALAT